MFLTSDYHTHTVFSHGKGDIIDNAIVAKEKGLKEIGISDHGPAHPVFGLSARKLPKMREKCVESTYQTGVNVLLGIESNIIGEDGTCDLKCKNFDHFDIFLAGVHKFVMYKPLSMFSLSLPNLFHTYIAKNNIPSWVVKKDTETYINVIKNNPVDIITHLNFCCFSNAKEVAKACADYGTYLELNSKKVHLTDKEIEDVLSTDCRFIISSDAHTPNRVGEISLVEKTLLRTGFPLDRIDNINGKVPTFRFRKFKEKDL